MPVPTSIPTDRELTVFNDAGNCAAFHTFGSHVLNVPLSEIRVICVSGLEYTFTASAGDLTLGTTLAALVAQSWNGGIGESDLYKHLAGSSPDTLAGNGNNLYLFDDHDCSNGDVAGCPAAGSSGSGRQTSVCPGTPNGLVSLGRGQPSNGLWGDLGTCNYKSSGEWGVVVREMYIQPA